MAHFFKKELGQIMSLQFVKTLLGPILVPRRWVICVIKYQKLFSN